MNKVFGIGLSRTGTKSLSKALRILGYSVKHYPHPNRVFEAAEKYDALTDSPVVPHYQELAEEYPDAKFVLTVRDVDNWLDSCRKHWAGFTPSGWGLENRHRVFGRIDFDADAFREVYDEHRESVLEYFADEPKRLLVLDICGGEGWFKLCEFLEADLPLVEFPCVE